MKNILKDILTPQARRWLYGVIIAAIPLCVALGWITEEIAPIIVSLAAALLGVSVAAGNVNDDEATILIPDVEIEEDDHDEDDDADTPETPQDTPGLAQTSPVNDSTIDDDSATEGSTEPVAEYETRRERIEAEGRGIGTPLYDKLRDQQ